MGRWANLSAEASLLRKERRRICRSRDPLVRLAPLLLSSSSLTTFPDRTPRRHKRIDGARKPLDWRRPSSSCVSFCLSTAPLLTFLLPRTLPSPPPSRFVALTLLATRLAASRPSSKSDAGEPNRRSRRFGRAPSESLPTPSGLRSSRMSEDSRTARSSPSRSSGARTPSSSTCVLHGIAAFLGAPSNALTTSPVAH